MHIMYLFWLKMQCMYCLSVWSARPNSWPRTDSERNWTRKRIYYKNAI